MAFGVVSEPPGNSGSETMAGKNSGAADEQEANSPAGQPRDEDGQSTDDAQGMVSSESGAQTDTPPNT